MKLLRKRFLTGMILSITLGITAGLLPEISVAKGGKGGTGARSNSVSLESAVARVQNRTGGRVLRAGQKGSHYVIKVLMPSGVVKTFRINAQGN